MAGIRDGGKSIGIADLDKLAQVLGAIFHAPGLLFSIFLITSSEIRYAWKHAC